MSIAKAREEERAQVVTFIQDLVRIPSITLGSTTTTDVGEDDASWYNECRAVDRIREEVRKINAGRGESLECRVHAKDPQHPNVVVSLVRGGGRGEEVGEEEEDLIFTLVAHADTVPVGDPSRWTHPPFAAHADEARQILYGRGACDNKAGIAVGLYTLKRLLTSLPPTFRRGRIVLAVVADEESGACSPFGLRHLLDKGVIKPCKAPASSSTTSLVSSPRGGSIYCYPGRTVTIGHRGVLRLHIQVTGSSIHTGSTDWAMKRKGCNALTALCEIITKIESYPWPQECHSSFPNLPLTVTPTLIQGGVGASIVPESAHCTVDCRIPPLRENVGEEIRQTIMDLVKEVIAKRNANVSSLSSYQQLTSTVSIHVDIPPYHIPPTHPLAKACVDAVEAVTGKTPEIRGAGPGNEGYMLGEAGIPCICGFGPLGGGAHGVDEWVEVGESLSHTIDIYERVILEAATAGGAASGGPG